MDGQEAQITTEARAAVGKHAFLIVDIRGYSTFTTQRGAAAAARLASTFTDLSRDAISARGGQLLGLRGDEVLAAFASPTDAVGAAVEIRAACAEATAADGDFPLRVGAGIDIGDAVVIDDGYHGSAINLAARLCALAGPGQILVSRSIVEASVGQPELGFVAIATVPVKGFDRPVEMHEVAERPAPGVGSGIQSALGRPVSSAPTTGLPLELDDASVLAGRVDELSWLRGHWRAARRGRGRVVVLAGPSGAGKTRLAAELARTVASAGDPVHYAGTGGAGPAETRAAIAAAASGAEPGLWVLDDLDVDPGAALALDAAYDTIAATASLVLVLVADLGAAPAITGLVERIGRIGPGAVVRQVLPLDVDAVRTIARSYVPDIEDLPAETITRASGGLPGGVHEMVARWAGDEARRRLEAAAEWLAEGTTRRAADLRFADTVIAAHLGRIYDTERAAAPRDGCPYKGLETFDEADAAFFFGREQLVGELAARTVGVGFLAVVGPSGSGKSSAVLAGLVPSLRAGLLPGSERWTPVVMRPGEHPLTALDEARAGRSGADHTGAGLELLVVDQFEEVFTTTTDPGERDGFVARLVALAAEPGVVVVVTIRADYTGHCAPYPELAALVAANLVLVGPMTPDQLRRVIAAPARRVGVRVESSLVEALVAEVAGEPGGLPLLSTALVQLWQRRDAGWLRVGAYEATGGVRAAVARAAEESYERFSDAERATARTIFLRLVDAGEGESAVRRRVPIGELDLVDDPSATAVVTALVGDRLLIRHDDRIEIAHEALIREWPRLGAWLVEDATGRQLRSDLTRAARQWAERGRDPGDLYRGARLSMTLDWWRANDDRINQLEREFLEVGQAAGQAQLVRERRINRRLQTLLAGTAVFLVAALIAGLFAWIQRDHARSAQQAAQTQALRSDAERVGTLAQTEPNLDRSLLLAVAGVRLDNRPETRSDLLAALERSPAALHVLRPSTSEITGVAISPDGRTLVTGDASGVLRFEDLRTWTELGAPVRLSAPIAPNAVRFSPDGSTLAVATGQGDRAQVYLIGVIARAIRLIGTWSEVVPAIPNGSTTVAFSPDGTALAVGLSSWSLSQDNPISERLVVLDPRTGAVRWSRSYPMAAGGQDEPQVAFSPAGSLVTSAEGGTTDIWDARTGQLRRTYPVGGRFALSPDGTQMVIGVNTTTNASLATSVVLLDLPTGRTRSLQAVTDATWTGTVAFSPDGRTVLDGSLDGDVRVWNISSGQIASTFATNTGGRTQIAIDPTGRTVVSGHDDGSVLAWDLSGDQSLGKTFAWSTPSNSCPDNPCFAINPAGTVMATDEGDGTVDLIDLRTRTWDATLPAGHGVANGIAFTPSGELVTGDAGGDITFWNTTTRASVRHLQVAGPVYSLAISPDGARLAAQIQADGSSTTTVDLIDLTTGRPVRSYRVPDGAGGVAFSPNGDVLAALGCCSPASVVDLWDVSSGRALPSPRIPGQLRTVAFRPGSTGSATSTLGIGTGDGHVYLWDVAAGSAGHEVGPPVTVAASNVEEVVFSPDGQLLAASIRDGSIDLVDLASGQLVGGSFPVETDVEPDVLFNPDGDLIINYVGTATDWPTSLSRWESYACHVAGRELSRAEWTSVLPSEPYEAVCPTQASRSP